MSTSGRGLRRRSVPVDINNPSMPSATTLPPLTDKPMRVVLSTLSSEERSRKLSLGLSLYCGQKEHLHHNCSIDPSTFPMILGAPFQLKLSLTQELQGTSWTIIWSKSCRSFCYLWINHLVLRYVNNPPPPLFKKV